MMNEHIKELAEQAGLKIEDDGDGWVFVTDKNFFERFAELIRQDEREQISHTYLKLTMEAVLREREACAKLCEAEQFEVIEDGSCQPYNTGCQHSAAAIRQRGEQP